MNRSAELDQIGAVALYEEGVTLEAIATKVNCATSTVSMYLHRHGIPIRSRGMVGVPCPIGTTVGIWEVLSEKQFHSKIGRSVSQCCKCTRCGYEARVNLHNPAVKKSKSCNKCKSSKILSPKGDYDVPFIIHSYFVHHILKNVKRRQKVNQLEFNITIEYLIELFEKQKGKCAISGMALLEGLNLSELPLSLDRIDSNVGYVIGNVQWVHKDINMMKQCFSNDRFIGICCQVALHQAFSQS